MHDVAKEGQQLWLNKDVFMSSQSNDFIEFLNKINQYINLLVNFTYLLCNDSVQMSFVNIEKNVQQVNNFAQQWWIFAFEKGQGNLKQIIMNCL